MKWMIDQQLSQSTLWHWTRPLARRHAENATFL